ncbi:MAG: SDR family NAD(P)-dependent oxidoreductase, partial [Bacillota bacterium]|nr:SDR family NAD(P)-dependent oxidoreductase [Bacillota bacterium]
MSILNSFALPGKVAIVTGASTGLGQGMALGLAEAGCDIVGVDYVDMPDTRKAVLEQGRRFLSIVVDLVAIHPDGLKKIVEDAVATFGKIDILVNNAGIIRREDSLAFSEKNWDDVMNINVKTVFFFSQAAANQFVKQGTGGKIISVASMLSYQGGIRVP